MLTQQLSLSGQNGGAYVAADGDAQAEGPGGSGYELDGALDARADGRSVEEVGAQEQRLDNGFELVVVVPHDLREFPHDVLIRVGVDEFPVELATYEFGGGRLVEDDVGDAQVVQVAEGPEEFLGFVVVTTGVEDRLLPFNDPPGKCSSCLGYILFSIVPDSHGEEFKQFASIVFVGFALLVQATIQVVEHRRVGVHDQHQALEVPESVLSELSVLVKHQLGTLDLAGLRGEMIVPEQGHPLDERERGAREAVHPPATQFVHLLTLNFLLRRRGTYERLVVDPVAWWIGFRLVLQELGDNGLRRRADGAIHFSGGRAEDGTAQEMRSPDLVPGPGGVGYVGFQPGRGALKFRCGTEGVSSHL